MILGAAILEAAILESPAGYVQPTTIGLVEGHQAAVSDERMHAAVSDEQMEAAVVRGF